MMYNRGYGSVIFFSKRLRRRRRRDGALHSALELELREHVLPSGDVERRGELLLDLPALDYTIMLNGVTQLVVTKIDVLTKGKKQ